MILYFARKRSGVTLAGIGAGAGDIDYKTVGKAVQRLEKRMQKDKNLRRLNNKCIKEMSNVET